MAPLKSVAVFTLVGTANAFTVPSGNLAPQASSASRFDSPLFAEDDSGNFVERGVSMDQDGKSNVWAIEPKMEVENKSSEEKTGSLLVGLGAFGAFAVIAGGLLANLPDPDQF